MKSIPEKNSGAGQTEPGGAQEDLQRPQSDSGMAAAGGGRPVKDFKGIAYYYPESQRPQDTIFPDPALHPGISFPALRYDGKQPDLSHPFDGPGSIAPIPPWDCPGCGTRGLRSKYCPECGRKMPDPGADRYWDCPACGAKAVREPVCPVCGAKRPGGAGSWICPECGRTDITGKFCPECGHWNQDQ